jgi:peptidyl-prolyl cis-trans isomerase A (cyclophilin A)
MRFSKLCKLTVSFIALAGCLTFNSSAQTSTAKPKSATAAKSAASSYDHSLLKPELLKDTSPATYQVQFDTTRGVFTITVHRDWAPNGADRFYNLVKHHYYDGARLYRVIPNFVAQFGINAHPPVNVAWAKATIKDDPVTQKNVRGTLTFAKTSQPNSRTTEVFISLKDNSFLDSQGFAPFATIDEKGINVVEMFYDQYPDPAAAGEQPAMEKSGEPYIANKFPKLDTIKSATIVGAPAAAKPVNAKPAVTTKAAPTTTTKPKP